MRCVLLGSYSENRGFVVSFSFSFLIATTLSWGGCACADPTLSAQRLMAKPKWWDVWATLSSALSKLLHISAVPFSAPWNCHSAPNSASAPRLMSGKKMRFAYFAGRRWREARIDCCFIKRCKIFWVRCSEAALYFAVDCKHCFAEARFWSSLFKFDFHNAASSAGFGWVRHG